jgi:hypothetical protein
MSGKLTTRNVLGERFIVIINMVSEKLRGKQNLTREKIREIGR